MQLHATIKGILPVGKGILAVGMAKYLLSILVQIYQNINTQMLGKYFIPIWQRYSQGQQFWPNIVLLFELGLDLQKKFETT